MNKKTAVLMVVILGVLGIVCIYLLNKDKSSWKSEDAAVKKLLPESFDVNKITKMKIYDKDNSVMLKKDDGSWKVEERKNYPADFSKIGSFILKLSELKIIDTVDAGKSQFGRLKLLEPGKDSDKEKSGTVIELQDDSGKVVEKLILGKMHHRKNSDSPFGGEMPDGRYIKLASAEKPVLINETLFGFSTKPNQWLDKDFIKIKDIKSVKCTSSDSSKNWTVEKSDKKGQFKLEGVPEGKTEDISKINSAMGAFNYFTFTDLYMKDFDFKPNDEFKETATLIIKTFDDFTYTVKMAEGKEKCIAQFNVDAVIPEKRIQGKDEKKEDKEKLDKEFKEKQQKLKEKLEKEKQFAAYIYEIPKYKMDSILKKKTDLVKDKPKVKTVKKSDTGKTASGSAEKKSKKAEKSKSEEPDKKAESVKAPELGKAEKKSEKPDSDKKTNEK
jgi:hypothetical protein